MKKFIYQVLTVTFILGTFAFFSTGCDPDDPEALDNALGWFGIGGTNGDDTANIENDINFGQGDLPASADLSNKFPPIGNQGSYGTCVSWAVGYNHKSFLEAVDNSRTTSDMTNQNYVYSPKYLFWAIADSDKGADCNGTGFEPAYDVMINSGIASLQVTPYTDLGDCSGSTSQWDASASQFLIESYRQVDVNKDKIKQYLAQGRALSFGAKLGDNFMAWNSSSVLYSDTYEYNGQHAYHAMTLCGYDDSKGTNGAFRVVNSWGTGWGDNGYIWVDENFFVDEFAFCVFAATNKRSNPDDDGDNEVDDPNSGDDLLAWELLDEDNGGGLNRIAKYNVFNSGSTEILASSDWNILYIYYNANNANDYGIMLYDYYSNDYGSMGEDGELVDGDGDQSWWNHINVPSGQSVAQALYGGDNARFQWPYTMPEITGDYYLVIMADGYDVISEFDESNNYFYLTDQEGGPITFENGIMQEVPAGPTKSKNLHPQIGDPSEKENVRVEGYRNTYTTKEITKMIKHRKASGDIQRKAALFIKNKNKGSKSNG